MGKYFLHAVGATGDIKDINKSLKDLEGILKTGAILTRDRRNLLGAGFNGTRYLSLSDFDKRFDNVYKNDPKFYDYTAYEMYSTKAVYILIEKNRLDVIQPTLVEPLDKSWKSVLRIFAAAYNITSKRMSDLPDEVQVYGGIDGADFDGVSIPVDAINEAYDIRKVKRVYKKIKELLEKYEYHIGIYDVADLEEITSEEDIENKVKRSH